MNDTKEVLLTTAEAAVIAQRSERTVWRWIEAKKLRFRRVLGRVLIARADLDELTARETAPPTVTA